MLKGQGSEYGIDEVRREARKLIEPVQKQLDKLSESVTSLGNAVTDAGDNTSFAEIVNNLDNSFPEWSKLAYTTLGVLPAGAGDTNLECYNFFRELETETDLTIDAANPLKAPKTIEPAEHSLFVAAEGANADIPRWDKVNGWMEIGGLAARWDLFSLLPNDLVFPGQTFYVQFEARLAAGAIPSGLQFYAGFWDNTAGQRKYIEGGSFTITGEIFGLQSGSTTVSYKVLARTDSGEEAISNTLTFTNAPAVFDQNNHPRISFSGVAGFIEFEIYRQIGTNFVLQFTVRNSIDGTYFDVGNPPQAVVSAFPTVTTTKPRAYAITSTFVPGSINGTDFVRHALTIFVPTTYDRSVTGQGMQFFRFGLNALTASARQIQIRKIGLSLGSGQWSRSPNDVRQGVHSQPSTTATGSPGGNGGGVGDPPEPGGGGFCTLMETPQSIYDDDGNIIEIPLEEVARLCREKAVYADSCGIIGGKILYVKIAHTSEIFFITTENGLRRGFTHNHPFITNYKDLTGTPLSAFKIGDTVWTKINGVQEQSKIADITVEYGSFKVGIPIQDGSHICVLGGFISDNEKPLDGFQS